MKKFLLLLISALISVGAYAQTGGMKGQVVSREGREPIGGVTVTIDKESKTIKTNDNGEFCIEGLAPGQYLLTFVAPDFEELEVMVRVKELVHDMYDVVMVPSSMDTVDYSAFNEYDTDAETFGDSKALPQLSASKDLFNNIASYRFSEMRFNVRGYDSQYQDVYLNGIRFNDALTSYGPWSLWSGLNDATRNQETTSGLKMSDYGVGGVAGTTNINARASQLRKGFRASVVNATQMYRYRVMLSYASGQLDNGWSYGFSLSTRQGEHGYVEGVYYNAFGYFFSAEKVFNSRHRLSATILAAPTQRGAQQASTQEAYDLFRWGYNYYNPNVGFQNGKLRNSRVRRMHEPIAMLNYNWQITENTRLSAATSLRFGYNGYSALTWYKGEDPRPDYYRRLPSYYGDRLDRRVMINNFAQANNDKVVYFTEEDILTDQMKRDEYLANWTGYIDFDELARYNMNGDTDSRYGEGHRSIAMIEERRTDQLDYNLAVQLTHDFKNGSQLTGGVRARINRTEYYSTVKDLLGGDYWVDVDKFAERDFGSGVNDQNDMAYYREHGHAKAVKEGDKYNYDYYAHVRQSELWGIYKYAQGGLYLNLGAEVGYSSMWREGLWEKGLFQNANAGGDRGKTSLGESDKVNTLTYKVKVNTAYKFSGAHSIEANIMAAQNAPNFNNAFVSARTRNQITPGLSSEKIYGVDATYNLRLPWIKARFSAYYTQMQDMSKVISFYDDTQGSFTNFAMSGIDKCYKGVELGYSIPIAWGLSLQGAVSLGDYTYTSNPQFTQMIDNNAIDVVNSYVDWKGMKVESTPQTAINVGFNFRGANNWYASLDFNYYDDIYLSMNPAYRTQSLREQLFAMYKFDSWENGRQKAYVEGIVNEIRAQEDLGSAYTLSASIGKNWRIAYKYTLGFSLQVNNILNNQDIRTGGYEQMRLNKLSDPILFPGSDGVMKVNSKDFPTTYSRFDSKYFYMNGLNYYLNVYFRF